MKKNTVSTLIFTLIGAFIPICWDYWSANHKELTIQEERRIDFLNKSNENFTLLYNDSIKLDDYNYIVEYSIINTGDATIVGYGPNSDILTVDNLLRIATDSIIVDLYENQYSITLDNNCISFKQIKPGEKISLICITNILSDNSIVQISDRDIKDTDIIYTKSCDKLTTFEKTTTTKRWTSVIGFLFNLLIIIALIIVVLFDFVKGKPFKIVLFVLWIMCLLYTMSLPLKWLL